MTADAVHQASGRAQAPAATGSGRFARLNLKRPIDFALHVPLRYENLTTTQPIRGLLPGQTVQVRGTVTQVDADGLPGGLPGQRFAARHSRAKGMRTLVVTLADDSGSIALRFVNAQSWMRNLLTPGQRILAHGVVRGGVFGLELVHPTLRVGEPDKPLPSRLTPVYPTVAGISQAAVRSAVREGLQQADLTETLPAAALTERDLPSFAAALRDLHGPPAESSLEAIEARTTPAWERVILDELVAQQLALVRARQERDAVTAPPLASVSLQQRLRANLPFKLTGAQERVVAEIDHDLGTGRAMHRLLQGDVGSGKTVVAALAAARAIGSHWQVALMAPTEILAEQHWRKLAPWLEPLGVRIAWLTGSLRNAEKRAARAAIANGEIDLAIGTHALVEDSTAFARLGLAIVDEQHRFGVAQRLALAAGKAGALDALRPHLLMMSATPIPRTLAMSYCADLDLSVIDELPPGRTPVLTRIIGADRREEVAQRIRHAVADGRQVYWVCPLIEESEALDLQTAIDTHAWLVAGLPELTIGLVHGRAAPVEKAATMAAFQAGTLNVLVSTTVIEVGVDVPNASLMIIEHAERFGLSQLHQLRGRVGRGAAASVCVLLVHYPASALAKQRLAIIRDTQDGFEIARRDLQLRGPGEFLGARQSGLPMLRFADLERDAGLLERARQIARQMLTSDLHPVERHVERWFGQRPALVRA